MGGEGGGVLADWIVDLGEHNGYLAQTTSVPGVAQRTGATIYYVELFPRAQAEADGGRPVLALMPLPGDVDVVLASELMEAGRAVQRGLVTPDRTTLVASTHRVYSIAEKSAMGDGRVDSAELLAHAQTRPPSASSASTWRRPPKHAGSVISAVLFGALAGAGVLPFSRAQFEATIERGGVGVQAEPEGLRRRLRACAGRGARKPARRCAAAPCRAAAARIARGARAGRARRSDELSGRARSRAARRRAPPRSTTRTPAYAELYLDRMAAHRALPRKDEPAAARDRAPPGAVDDLRRHGPRRRR